MYRLFKAALAAVAVIVSFAAFVVDAADVMVASSATGIRSADTARAESNQPGLPRSADSATPVHGR